MFGRKGSSSFAAARECATLAVKSLTFLCILTAGTMAWSQTVASNTRFGQLDQTAQAAQGSDPTALRSLVVEMFRTAGVQDEQAASFQDRIVAAELSYRAGQHAGVPEASIVQTLNQLATTLALPSYAQTSPGQLRRVRMALITLVPHIRVRQVEKQGNRISDQMSPAEAALVTLMLIKQKLDNPDFQVPPSVWEQNHPIVPPGAVGGAAPGSQPQLQVQPPADQALRTALSNAASGTQSVALLQLVNSLVTDLGY
ncbi:MAG: hypothetical protein ACLPXM_15860 [Terriglobales bacterium]